MKKIALAAGLIAVLSVSSVYALPERLLYCIATGIGASTWGAFSLCINKPLIAHLVGIPFGIGTGMTSYLTLYGITDEGKFERANKKIEHVLRNQIAANKQHLNSYMPLIHECYVTSDLWLIDGHEDLLNMLHETKLAINLFRQVRQSGSASKPLKDQSRSWLEAAHLAEDNLVKAIQEIRTNDEYPVQLMLQDQLAVVHKHSK